jgi:hypothetical protein
MKGRWGAAALVALVILGAGLAQTKSGRVLLQDAGLLQVPPSYTELAFTTPSNVPVTLKSAHAPIEVSFDIHNVSGSPRAYRWSITFVRSGRSHVKASGVVRAPAQGRATVATTFATVCVGGRLQVVVRLAIPTESIDFWATCVPSSRGT